jgi:peptidoglycan hydrolase-like protein with peptidoglycan-binding domain
MTESSATAAVETIQVTVTLPVLHRNPKPREVVMHLQHMLNDFAAAAGHDPEFNETGEYGPKTFAAIQRFQKAHGISPATGEVGLRTWKALLEAWLPPR